MMTQKLLTIEEAAKLLSIKVSRLRTAVFKREVPYIKIGRLVRFRQTDLEEWINENTKSVKKGVLDEFFS